MANVIGKNMVAKYLEALSQDETILEEAGAQFEASKVALEVGLRRYIALRDFVTEQLGHSPYTPGVEWPTQYTPDGFEIERGRFRFTGMQVGDAILAVLREQRERQQRAPNPRTVTRYLTLQQIVDALSDGGLGFPDPVAARSVNAALLRVKGIRHGKMANSNMATYAIDEELAEPQAPEAEVNLDPDDLPFEP